MNTPASSSIGQTNRPPARVRPTSLQLSAAAVEFWRHPTPWILAAVLAVGVVGRGTSGAFTGADLVVAAAPVLAFPLTEWVIHVVLLHWRPRRVGPWTVDPSVARSHRAHHAEPTDLEHVFIPLGTLLRTVAAVGAIAALGFRGHASGWTFVAVQGALGLVYEWTHYLVHTSYRPRGRAYRAIWRHHRLHHHKNEQYWFTVTTSGTADRLFGTQPDPSTVPTSPTARALGG